MIIVRETACLCLSESEEGLLKDVLGIMYGSRLGDGEAEHAVSVLGDSVLYERLGKGH